MEHVEGETLDRLRTTLRAFLRKNPDGGEVALSSAQIRLLVDEVGRVEQAGDRLRRQNRRLRLKLQRAGIAEDEGDVGGDDKEPGSGAD